MWYLFAFVDKLESFRTFGLDRIRNLVITDDVFQREPALEETAKRFDDVYGLVYEPDNNPTAPIEEVKLKGFFFHVALSPFITYSSLTGNRGRCYHAASDNQS